MDALAIKTLLVGVALAALTMGAPLLMAAIGELFAERSGVINIGLEGSMLVGAFAGVSLCYWSRSPLLGWGGGMLAGLLLAAVLALLAVTWNANQIVVGAGLNLFALGLTGVLYRATFGTTGQAFTVPTFQPILLNMNGLVYFALALPPIAGFALFRTRLGLGIRAVGEHPLAAETMGVSVVRVRWACVMLSGALAGAAGAYLSLAHSNTFVPGMSAGRGFMVLAIVIFGRWHPGWILLAALFFGAAGGLEAQLQALNIHSIPYQFAQMLPYVLTLLTLAGLAGRARPPAALALPYESRLA